MKLFVLLAVVFSAHVAMASLSIGEFEDFIMDGRSKYSTLAMEQGGFQLQTLGKDAGGFQATYAKVQVNGAGTEVYREERSFSFLEASGRFELYAESVKTRRLLPAKRDQD